MAIVAGFDVHRAQITFDALDTDSGEVMRGRIGATPAAVRQWVRRFRGRELHVAVEACTGWLFVWAALRFILLIGFFFGCWSFPWSPVR